MTTRLKLRARCTTCLRTYDVTEAQQREARDIGCLVSSCCQAVATAVSATVRTTPRKRARQ